MTEIQKHVALHCRNGRIDASKSIDSQVSAYNMRCLVGMVETGEATLNDMVAVGGEPLAAAVAKLASNIIETE